MTAEHYSTPEAKLSTATNRRYRMGLAVLAAATVGLLSGCAGGPPDAHDPRKGRTTISWSDCGLGSCVYDWKVCIGPDLHMHVSDATPQDYTLTDSPECAS